MTLICVECEGVMHYSREDAMYICSHCGHEDDGLVDEDEPEETYWQEYDKAPDSSRYVEDGVPF
jgi:DNA-directed RNA polymerase subunit M/transcription elongation factor TFIIS